MAPARHGKAAFLDKKAILGGGRAPRKGFLGPATRSNVREGKRLTLSASASPPSNGLFVQKPLDSMSVGMKGPFWRTGARRLPWDLLSVAEFPADMMLLPRQWGIERKEKDYG